MKRTKFLLGFISFLCILTISSCGTSNKAKGYSREKEMNEKLDEYARNGWQIHGSTRTLKGKLAEHYERLTSNPDLYEVIGTSTGCRSVTVCRASALNAASVDLATRMGQDLKGKTMRDMGIDEGAEVPDEYNKFQAACIGKFQATIQGDLQESIALIQQRNGLNNYEIYYVVDKAATRKKRAQAIKEAIEESNLRQDYARSVEKYINDDFE